jgi:hypothetical protein
VKRPNSSIVIVGVAVASLFGWPLAGCTDVGDDIGTDSGEAGGDATSSGAPDSGELDAAQGSVDARGNDAGSAPGDAAAEAAEENPGTGEDAGVQPETIDAGVSAPPNTEGPPPVEPGGNDTVDAGGEPTAVVDAGANAVVDAGANAVVDAGANAVVDAGASPTVDTGAAQEVDAGIDATIGEPGLDASVSEVGAPDTGSGPIDATVAEAGRADASVVDAGLLDTGGAGCVGGVSNVCPNSNPICTNGLTQGIGTASGGCNQTETTILQTEGESCLECLLNFSCLHDMQGDNPSTDHSDCDDLSGTVPADAGAGAGTSLESDCISLLSCALTSKCGEGNSLDCYCGIGVNGTTCKTSPTGACLTETQIGLASTDPNYIEANATDLKNTNGGATVYVILNCAKNNCDPLCFQ